MIRILIAIGVVGIVFGGNIDFGMNNEDEIIYENGEYTEKKVSIFNARCGRTEDPFIWKYYERYEHIIHYQNGRPSSKPGIWGHCTLCDAEKGSIYTNGIAIEDTRSGIPEDPFIWR